MSLINENVTEVNGTQQRAIEAQDFRESPSIEDEFSALMRPEYHVHVSRVRPEWCAGFLERINIEENQDLAGLQEEIVSNWGGHVFKLQLRDSKNRFVKQITLHAKSFAPLVKGRKLSRYEIEVNQNKEQREERPETIGNLLGTAISSMMKQQESFFEEMKKYTASPPAEMIPKDTALGNALDVARQYKELQKMFNTGAAVEGGNEGDIMGVISQFMSVLNPAAAKPAPQSPFPVSSPVRPGMGSSDPLESASSRRSRDMKAILSNGDPERVGNEIIDAMGSLPFEQRARIFQTVMDRIGVDPSFVLSLQPDRGNYPNSTLVDTDDMERVSQSLDENDDGPY
jgi:hypothetical protein